MTLLVPLVGTLAPPVDDMSFMSPVPQAYSVLTSFVGALGMLFLARGLSSARRHESAGPVPGLAILLTVIALLSSGITTLSVAVVQYYDVTAVSIGLIGATLVANLVGTLALVYLVVVSLGGWFGQERPRASWGLAAVGAGLVLLERLTMPFVGMIPASQEVLFGIASALAAGELLGWVLVVVAFAMGLSSTDSVPDRDLESAVAATADQPAVTRQDSAAS